MHGFFIVGQNISSPRHFINNTCLLKTAQLVKTVGLFIVMTSLLTSCSSQVAQKKITKEVIVSKDSPTQLLNAEQTITFAQEMITDNVDGATINEAIRNLTNASQLYLQEKNYNKAIWLAEKTIRLTSEPRFNTDIHTSTDTEAENNQPPNQATQLMQLMLIKAQSYQALNYNELSYQELEKITSFAQQHNLALTFDYYQLKSDVLQSKSRAIASLQASLYAFSLDTQKNEDLIAEARLLLWQKIKMLSPWQVDLLTKRKAPDLDGWLKLNQYANKFGNDSKQLSRYVSQWHRQYPNHPASSISLQLLQQNLTQEVIENVAIILPLTGNQNSAGLAIQQGILAGFEQDNRQQNTQKTLHFFDSNTLDWQSLSAKFIDKKIDFVIGPLLKSHLDKYLELNLTSTDTDTDTDTDTNTDNNQQQITKADIGGNSDIDRPINANNDNVLNYTKAMNLPTLFLNLPKQQVLAANQVAFSMSPEDEAIQAAASLSQIGFKQAIVLSHQDKVSKRIALAFVSKWQEKTGQSLDIVYFEQGSVMQDNLQASLGIKSSQSRIDELQGRVKQTIKAQTRNRRDIDMIYVVGSAQQTRLVKPYIDVNISPFSTLIPIYASSRSHSIKNDTSSTNDLRGLTFTEMPWLLTSTSQNESLAKLSAKLWPKRNDNLSRIFAMGFDSYNLINKLGLMQQAPYIHHFGQTGVLQLNNNILTRSLIWGRYQQKGVSQITLD